MPFFLRFSWFFSPLPLLAEFSCFRVFFFPYLTNFYSSDRNFPKYGILSLSDTQATEFQEFLFKDARIPVPLGLLPESPLFSSLIGVGQVLPVWAAALKLTLCTLHRVGYSLRIVQVHQMPCGFRPLSLAQTPRTHHGCRCLYFVTQFRCKCCR